LAGHIRTRAGGGLPGVAPSNAYPTADGRMMMIAANADPIWARLAEAMGRVELASDDRFFTHENRGRHASEVDTLVADWTSTMDFMTLDQVLAAAAIPHGLIYRAPDVLNDPQYLARETVQRIHDDVLGRQVPMPSVVPRLARTPGAIRWAGGEVGAHTQDVLTELGLTDDERDALDAAGVIRRTS
jgi:formyl-CoA transferase